MSDEATLGTIKPNESKEFQMRMPPGARPGDEMWFELTWTCGSCGQDKHQTFHTVLGQPSHFNFGCDCGNFWNRLKRFFK